MRRLFPKFSIIVILIVISKCSLLGQSQAIPPGEIRISCTANNILVKDLFEIVWQQTKLQAFYNDEQLNSFDIISVDFKNTPLDKVLAELVGKRGLKWRYREGAILILPRKKNIKNRASLISENTRLITGSVFDENKKPIHGVSVRCGSAGTLTDIHGKFQLNNVKKGAVLQVQKLGYQPRVLPSYADTLSIQLITFVAPLKPVDVNGIRKYLLTASVSSVTQEDMEDQPAGNILSALQGKIPGLYINQTTGLPGGGYRIRLRGKNSMESSCYPLIVVDGIPYPSLSFNDNFINMVANGSSSGAINAAGPLNLLSINDIASIDILKDASATALYGSRGTNGVIVIHSKQTKENEHRKTVNVYTGIGKASRMIKYLDTKQYIQMRKEAFRNDHREPGADDPDLLLWDTTSSYTDWQKRLIGNTAKITDVSVEIKEGNAMAGVRLSSTYRRESTVYPDEKFRYEKRSIMAQGYYRSKNKKFNADLSLSYVKDRNRLPGQDLTYFVTLPPNAPDTPVLNFAYSDPDAYLLREYLEASSNLRPVVAIRYAPVKEMFFEANLGANTLHLREIHTVPEESNAPVPDRPKGISTFNYNTYRNAILNVRGGWEKSSGKERLSVLAGASFQRDKQLQKGVYKYDYPTGKDLTDSSLALSRTTLSETDTIFQYRSYYLQLVFKHADKYIITLVANRDGSTRLSTPDRYANFGTVGAAWIFSREKWFGRDAILSYGRIRGSWGLSGNDQYAENIVDDKYIDRGDLPAFANNLHGAGFLRYGWEKIRRSELAVDLGFKDDRYLFTFCYYNNRSRNQLLTARYKMPGLSLPEGMQVFRHVPPHVYVPVNVPAVVSNTGFEIDVEAMPVKKKHFSWTTSLNISFPKNQLKSFPGIENTTYKDYYQERLSLDMRKNYHMTGIHPEDGYYTFSDDGRVHGKELGPDFYGGLQHNLRYHGFELSMFIRFARQRNYDYLYAFGDKAPGMMANQPATVLDRWRQKNDQTTVQRFTAGSSPAASAFSFALQGDQRIIETSFARLQSLSLGYYLPEKLLKPKYLKSCKFYLQGYNLFTLTDYKGRDPEIIADIETYPTLRIMTLGIQLSF